MNVVIWQKKYIQRSCSIAKRQRRMRRTKLKIKTFVSVGLTICQDFLSQISLEIQITALVKAQWPFWIKKYYSASTYSTCSKWWDFDLNAFSKGHFKFFVLILSWKEQINFFTLWYYKQKYKILKNNIACLLKRFCTYNKPTLLHI